VTSSTFKPGDEVLLRIKDAETFCAATVLDVHDRRGIHIKFAIPNSDGDLEDWVDAADLTLASEFNQNDIIQPEKSLLDHALDCVRRGH
jgi:hypothetical protein